MGEWVGALLSLGYPDRVSTAESNKRRATLFRIIDLNGTGAIDVQEFCRGLDRDIDIAEALEEKAEQNKGIFKIWKPILPSTTVADGKRHALLPTVFCSNRLQGHTSTHPRPVTVASILKDIRGTAAQRPSSHPSVRARDIFGRRPFITSLSVRNT